MNILLTHGWLRGNLGDFCISRQCIRGLRSAIPNLKIALITEPCEDWEGKREIASLVDSMAEEPYQTDRSHLFRQVDAIINAPGGGLQNRGDHRGPFMLRDAQICGALGIPHFFASHSFHPAFDVSSVERSLFIAREPESFSWLRQCGCNAVSAADLAFLEPMPEISQADRAAREKVLLFLRFDHFKEIRLEKRMLHLDGRTVELPDLPLVLASSDPRRDSPRLEELSRAWQIGYEPSIKLEHLLQSIARSAYVVSDRYHPIIFAHMLGVPFTFLERKGSLRDRGLARLLRGQSTAALKDLARGGMEALCGALQAHVTSC